MFNSLILGLIVWGMQSHAMEQDGDLEANAKSVSYLYYPGQHEMPVGHAGFAFDDAVDCEVNQDTKSLREIIEKTQKKDGYPFFRFTFDVNSHEFEKIGKIIRTPEYILQDNCSVRALKPLVDAGVCSVPFSVSMSPLLTAAYLTYGKKVGSNRVSKIEFYRGSSQIKNAARIIPGLAVESLIVIGAPVLIGIGGPYIMHKCYSMMAGDDS